jgi:3-oxoacyl-[acyl-carrier protein] reductase
LDLGIHNRLALVTGASRGIGRAIAAELAREGARLLLVARDADQLEVARREFDNPDHHRCVAVDLVSDGGVDRVVEAAAGLGEIDIIVHNLGGSARVFQTLMSSEDWSNVWKLNVGVGHDLNRVFVPMMAKRGWGRVVHISSLAATTHKGYAAYASAKCALDGYVKSVNRQFSKDNVIISAVAPGAIYTEGRFFAKLQKEDPAALDRYFDSDLPIGRLGRAEEVAPVVAFLCSEKASFMAGSIVSVDGGGM